jgi:beta-lactamase regulating signal transducer with metallopeptidase domain
MSEMFRAILNMSITASFVIAAVIVARLLLRRAPKAFSYALWAVVLFNLLCPIKFEAPISLNPIHSEAISAGIVNEVVEISPLESAYGALSTALTDGYQPVNTEPYVSDTDGKVWTTANVSDGEMIFRFMSWLWPVGVAAMLLYAVISYALLRRKLRVFRKRRYLCPSVRRGGRIHLRVDA